MNIKRNKSVVRTGSGIAAFFIVLCFLVLAAGGVKENLLPLVLLLLASLTGGFVIFRMGASISDLNHWYEQILDFVYLPMSVTDMDMNWTFINAPVKNIIGVERADVMGHQCSEWNADICGTEKCGIAMLMNGLGTSYFTNEGLNMNFKVDTTYLYDRKHPDKKIGHVELVSDVTTKIRLDSAVAAIKESSQTMATTIEQEAATTTELSATAEQFSQNLKSITSNTNNQFSIIEEVVSAIEEMAASIQSVSKNTGNMADKSKENVTESKRGHAIVSDSLKGINVVNESLNSIVDQIARLHENTQKVDEILQVINNIASQTNLLSMNAAIEAAHAGEAGKGFSVVAEEIRKLAESSQMSSKEIESILKDVQKGVQETISISTESRDQVQTHLDSFGMSLESFDTIVENVGAIDRMIAEIDSITEEQSGATGDILGNIKGLMSLSQEIKGAVTEQSMGIEQISSSLIALSEGTNENVKEADRLKQTAHDLDLGE